jgi:hypothetical protein
MARKMLRIGVQDYKFIDINFYCFTTYFLYACMNKANLHLGVKVSFFIYHFVAKMQFHRGNLGLGKDDKRYADERMGDRSGNTFLCAFGTKKIVTYSPFKCPSMLYAHSPKKLNQIRITPFLLTNRCSRPMPAIHNRFSR